MRVHIYTYGCMIMSLELDYRFIYMYIYVCKYICVYVCAYIYIHTVV